MGVQQGSTGGNDVPGLGIEQANGSDIFPETSLTQFQYRSWSIGHFVQAPGSQVDTDIRRLCRENDSNQKLEI